MLSPFCPFSKVCQCNCLFGGKKIAIIGDSPFLCPLLVLGVHVGVGRPGRRHLEGVKEGRVRLARGARRHELRPQHLHLTLVHLSLLLQCLCGTGRFYTEM